MSEEEKKATFSPRALKAKEYFEQGYNCAQAVALAFTEETGLTPEFTAKLSSSFGGGMGRLREVCGTVSGAFLVLAAIHGISDPKDTAGKAAQYKDLQDLAKQFRDENGSIVCRDLLGLTEAQSTPTPDKRTSDYYRKRPCGELVACSTQYLEAYLENRKKAESETK